MKKPTMELTVGLFVLVGLACIAYLTIRLGEVDLLKADGYVIEARFVSVAGLKKGAAVEIAGVQVGEVKDITLDEETYEAIVDVRLRQDIELSDDSIISVRTRGLIGDKYLSVQPGGSTTMIEPGATVYNTESAVDLEGLVSKFAHGSL